MPNGRVMKQPFLREYEGKEGKDFLIQRTLFDQDSHSSEILDCDRALSAAAQKSPTTRKPARNVLTGFAYAHVVGYFIRIIFFVSTKSCPDTEEFPATIR